MLKIWGRDNSSNVRKVRWAAEEMGLPYEHIPAGGTFGITKDAAYQAMNPNGLVPCIEDDGLVLWESNAIVRYLAAKHGKLWPSDPAVRAAGDKWMDWANSTLHPALRDAFIGLLRTPPEKRNQAAIEASAQNTAKVLAIVDAALARQPYLSGEEFAMGDIPVGSYVYGWYGLPLQRPVLPHLDAWYERLKQRPAYRKAVMTPLT
jgi:glutathione S-transferase